MAGCAFNVADNFSLLYIPVIAFKSFYQPAAIFGNYLFWKVDGIYFCRSPDNIRILNKPAANGQSNQQKKEYRNTPAYKQTGPVADKTL
jgi:hypothetical protein